MDKVIKLNDFFMEEVAPAFKSDFITTCKAEYGANLNDSYDIGMLRDILNAIMLNTPRKGAF